MSPHEATVHIDGGSRGNPGPASYALVLRRPGHPDVEEAEMLGRTTNNVAEYTALVRALERASELGIRTLAVFSDSELMVKQMKGEYRVKSPDLQELYREAVELRKRFERVTITHVRREFNSDADRLCNEAMDGRPRPRPSVAEEPPAAPETTDAVEEVDPLRIEAIAMLMSATASWAKDAAEKPTPEELWDDLWELLKHHDVLKKKRGKKEGK